MRPSSASFSLFMVSTVSERVSLGGEERFSTMLVSSEFVVSAASKNCQRVLVTKTINHVKDDDKTYQVEAPWAGGSKSQQRGK